MAEQMSAFKIYCFCYFCILDVMKALHIVILISVLIFWFQLHHYIRQEAKVFRVKVDDPVIADDVTCRSWPPDDPDLLLDAITGNYELTLKPCVQASKKSRSIQEVYAELMDFLYPNQVFQGGSFRRRVLKDQETRLDQKYPNFDLYPQAIDIPSVVSAVRSGGFIKHEPINNPPLFVNTLPRNTCIETNRSSAVRHDNLDLVIIIKTCAGCLDRRNLIRKTFMQAQLWGKFHVQFTFVVGQVQYDSHRKWVPHEIQSAHEKELIAQRLINESARYNDLLMGSFTESYYNLHQKLMFTFRWASVFCRRQSPLFLFIDDDVTVVPSRMTQLIHRIPETARPFIIAGVPDQQVYPIRPARSFGRRRWALDFEEYPYSLLPPYHWGMAYLIGREVLLDAAIAMSFVKPLPVDDMYLGVVWKKLHYPLLGFREFTYNALRSKWKNESTVAIATSFLNTIDWTPNCSPSRLPRGKKICAAVTS